MHKKELHDFCMSPVSVTSELAKNPTVAIHKVSQHLFGKHLEAEPTGNSDAHDLEEAYMCGQWGGTRPSPLFLRIYADVLKTLQQDPLNGVCSPNLMGTNGVCPLTIIATIPDICRHMSNLIVRAQHEIFLATNYWMISEGSKLITNAMKELSRRCVAEGRKIVIKVMYDRGDLGQVVNNHQKVEAKKYADPEGKVVLPHPDEIPNITLEVVNYHKPALGTFHAKFMIVDRQIAITQSNNIQDNDNVEMMAQWEGDIVDSLYDMALITWHNELSPPLPCLATPARGAPTPSAKVPSFAAMFDKTGQMSQNGKMPQQGQMQQGQVQQGQVQQGHLYEQGQMPRQEQMSQHGQVYDQVTMPQQGQISQQGQSLQQGQMYEQGLQGQMAQLGLEEQTSQQGHMPQQGQMPQQSSDMKNAPPPANGNDDVRDIAAYASSVNMAQHTSKESHYDVDLASEVIRATASLNPRGQETNVQSVCRLLNGPSPDNAHPSAPEIAPADMMTPMVPIAPHEPFPMAMVNRPPYGGLNHKSLHNPQNASWTSALRYAESNVFIQTPDLNARDLIPEILSACRRGVHVTYFYCLGYNDAGELLPGQDGHNEMVAHNFYKDLEVKFHANLDIFVYVAKDQVFPIHNKFKKRSCHIKLMIVDDHIGIQGSGNQDTQSWYHSQEVNVMFDSEVVCRKWMDGIRQNQNTHLFGQVRKEGELAGCWVDEKTGKMGEGAIGVDPGKFAWAKGMVGAVNRVRGVGGF